MKFYSTACFAVSLCFLCSTSFADEIYTWITPDGVAHFSNKKEHPQARLADLPALNKGDFKVGAPTGATCDKHGGINCEVGPDTDGSVTCFDGFKNASARFNHFCGSPKLSISDISEPDNKGKVTVYVRNNFSVPAQGPTVTYTNPEGAKLKLKGPAEIPPFQMAEFSMYSGALALTHQKPAQSEFNVSCANCS